MVTNTEPPPNSGTGDSASELLRRRNSANKGLAVDTGALQKTGLASTSPAGAVQLGAVASSAQGKVGDDRARMELAEERREAFRAWVLTKSSGSKAVPGASSKAEDRGVAAQRLQERLAAAEQARAQVLERVRQRAAASEARREQATARRSERQETLALRVQASLTAAEERRAALLEQDRERLRAEHELVLARLAQSKGEENPAADLARKRLDERLAAAEAQRQQRLAQAAMKAGSKVTHAKAVSARARQAQRQQAVLKREALEARLESAQARRQASLTPPGSAAGSPRPVRARVSVGGSPLITGPAPALASAAGADVTPMRVPSPVPQPRASRDGHMSGQLLQHVGDLMAVPPVAAPKPRVEGAAHTAPLHRHGDAMFAARVEALRRHVSTRKLQAAWRAFQAKHRTTASLAQVFVDTGVITLPALSRSPSAAGAVSAPPSQPASPAKPPLPPGGPAVVGALNSPVRAPRGADQFDAFARKVQAPSTLRAASALLRRLEARLRSRPGHAAAGSNSGGASTGSHAHRGASHAHGHTNVGRKGHHHHHDNNGSMMTGSASERNVTRILRRLYPDLAKDRVPDRYPPRILLCSLMIIHYPEVVFNGTGDREEKLAAASRGMITAFERLLARILAPGPAGAVSRGTSDAGAPPGICASPVTQGIHSYFAATMAAQAGDSTGSGAHVTIGQRLVEFDEAWLQYLDQFAAWKLEDAASLETELVRVACEMERSLQSKLVRSSSGSPTHASMRSARNLDSVAAQVQHDYELLRERIERLSGPAGLARLDAALTSVRESVAAESMSEMESASEMEEGATDNDTPRTGTPTHPPSAPRSAPGGIRRGFFSSPSAASTPPVTPPQRTSLSPFASPPPSALARRGSEGLGRSASAPGIAAPAPAPTMPVVADVRAPSVPRSPAVSSPGAASALAPSDPNTPTGAAGPLTSKQLAADAASVNESIANLQMVWELAHNPAHRISDEEAEGAWARACAPAGTPLPELDPEELQSLPPDALMAAIRSHARHVAEEAFWGATTTRVDQALLGDKVADDLAGLISELGTDLAELVTEPNLRAALKAEFEPAALLDALGGQGCPSLAAVQALVPCLQRIAGLLLANGAPARELDAKAVHAQMAGELGAAIAAALPVLASRPSADQPVLPQVATLAAAITRVLRALRAQLLLIKSDAANARLAMLSQQVRGDVGVTYLRTKFAALHGLPADWAAQLPGGAPLRPQLVARLPRTAHWMTRATVATPAIHAYVGATGLDLNSNDVITAADAAAVAAAAAAAVPANLRAGLRATGSSTGAAAAAPSPAGAALAPCTLASWAGVVRTGVVGLVSSDKPAVSTALAETLAWDAERLHAAQNSFQQLVVMTAGLLLVQQTRARAGRPALAPAVLMDARRRLQVVLADPSMSLAALVSELHALATHGVDPTATPAEPVDGAAAPASGQSEAAALGSAFRALMNPGSAAFTSISNALAGGLSVHLLLGSAALGAVPAAGRAVMALLGRVGAAPLQAEVEVLAKQLAAVCRVSERVFAPVYEALASQPPAAPSP